MKLSGSPVEVRAQGMHDLGSQRQGVSRFCRRLRRLHARAFASARRRGGARAARADVALRQDDVQRRCSDALREAARRADAGRSADLVLGATAEPKRSKARSSSRAPRPAAQDRRHARCLSRQDAGRALGERARNVSNAVSAAARRFVHVPYGETDALDEALRRRGRVRRRAGARRRRRQRSAGRAICARARAVRSHRRALHRRRSADRAGSLRLSLRLRSRRRRSRRHDAGQGALRRRHSDRCVRRAPATRGIARSARRRCLHTSTFGGGELACAAALAAMDVLDEEGLVENARVRGEQLLRRRARDRRASFPTSSAKRAGSDCWSASS